MKLYETFMIDVFKDHVVDNELTRYSKNLTKVNPASYFDLILKEIKFHFFLMTPYLDVLIIYS